MSADLSKTTGEYVTLDGERYDRIANSHLMPEFFMSLVGGGDHWMFVSSTGALTAGRKNADNALFPYAADDQISAARAQTGPTTLIRPSQPVEGSAVWEPFAADSASPHRCRRNLYKTPLGTRLVFEEINETLGLAFRYRWVFSDQYGFVRSCRLTNLGSESCSLELLDGLQNVLPYGVGSEFMMRFSNLANAYKKSELLDGSELALFLLSSIPTDRAEPSEGLRATTLWQTGLSPKAILLSADQLPVFRSGGTLQTEADVRGRGGAYLLADSAELSGGESIEWHIVAELAQDHADVIGLHQWLRSNSDPAAALADDITRSERRFRRIVCSSDGAQCTANPRRSNRHLSNTVFNVMRGGVPLEGYLIHADDFANHVREFNAPLAERHAEFLAALSDTLTAAELRSQTEPTGDPDLRRLAMEYLPLAFSRRHGDPTRPWNRFSIDLESDNGRTNLNYQGNWRDIFQNWEALAFSFPNFSAAMICRFVNATTADGYNPYRITKNGFEWEEPTPDDPWANIGYWGDHQIIYLLKLLEWNHRSDPEALQALLAATDFVHAQVPYRIRAFEDIKADPQSTIDFDAGASAAIAARVAMIGADGKLLRDHSNEIHRVTLLEKLLTLSLAKLSNFVPDGGIWLNTQRPEWNDANNALVGNGLSLVTTCYLHRWFTFLHDWLADSSVETFEISQEVADFLGAIGSILTAHADTTTTGITPQQRALMVDSLSRIGSDYRQRLYQSGVTGQTSLLSREDCRSFFETARRHLAETIRNNRRPDGLFHAYNLIRWQDDGVEVEHLNEMLEGQVAVLSSGLLSADESVQLLDTLRNSSLFRPNQNSYMLYPDRQLPRFLEKNQISAEHVAGSPLLQRLIEEGNEQIVRRDVLGNVHFSGSFRNAADLQAALQTLPGEYRTAVEQEGRSIAGLFEDLFGHRRFTGRSGTFFAYEGLGSIYWHMVSKLGLAVAEAFFAAIDSGADRATIAALQAHYQSIRAGIGAEKTPDDYGAFPSDPYSHTPENAGVKQPGMTGQVKEDILARFAELGVHVEDGCLRFRFDLFDPQELLGEPQDFEYCDVAGKSQTIPVPAAAFAFTLCQVPVVCRKGDSDTIRVELADGQHRVYDDLRLDPETTRSLFSRTGEFTSITVRHCSL